MSRTGAVGAAAGACLAALLAFPPPASAATYAIRLPADTGYGSPYLRIVVDDPNTSTPGPSADVGATDFTLEAFVRGTTTDNDRPAVDCGATGSWTGANLIFDRHRIGGGETRSFGVGASNGRVVFGVTGPGGSATTLCGSRAVLDGFWHHVAAQRRRSDGRMTIWVDGVLDASADGPDGDVSYPDDAATPLCGASPCAQEPYLYVGGKKETQTASLIGSIDEVRISTTLRYATAFARPARAFTADASTAALYHFDEGSGTLARDAAGSGDATLSAGGAAAQWFEASPFAALPGTTPTVRSTGPAKSGASVAPSARSVAGETAPSSGETVASSPPASRAAAPALGRNRVATRKGLPAALLTSAAILAALGFVVAMIVFGIRAADRA